MAVAATARRSGESFRLKTITRPVASYALAAAAVGGAYLMARRLPLEIGTTLPAGHVVPLWSLVFVALALIFLGFLMLIVRRDLFSADHRLPHGGERDLGICRGGPRGRAVHDGDGDLRRHRHRRAPDGVPRS